MNAPNVIDYRREVGDIVIRDQQHSDPRIGATEARDQFPALADRTTIAVESLRSQWRTVARLGTHERMAISQLRVYGSMPMSELAARIALSRAAVTSLVDRLEATGWVKRHPDDHDRRRTVLTLLPQAAEEFDNVTEPWQAELMEWANSMSDEEWRTVATFMGRLGSIAERHATELRSTAAERSLS